MKLPDSAKRHHFFELARFGLAGVLNTVVGYAVFAGFIYAGNNLYVSQIGSHVIATTFAYASHRFFVFRMRPKLLRYLYSTSINYLVGLILLALISRVIVSPYLTGLITIACAAAFSYTSLKIIAFRARAARP